MTDFNGEKLNFNAKHRLARAVDQLIGICAGIAADSVLNDQELAFLSTWLTENPEVCAEFPGNQIARRVQATMADGVITESERGDLLETLRQISGNHFSETGAAAADTAAIPSDNPESITFAGKRYCFSGRFMFGSRPACQEAVIALGAQCDSDITLKTDYLVIGTLNSVDWKHESFGRKIERAQKLRDEGSKRPLILTEEQWAACYERARTAAAT